MEEYEEEYSETDDIITPDDISSSSNAGFGADISQLFLEDERVLKEVLPDLQIYFNAIQKLGTGQYSRQDEAKIYRQVDLMKTTHVMSSFADEYTWEHERQFTILKVLALKNLSMGRDGTFTKHAFGSIRESTVVQTLNNSNEPRKSGLLASLFHKNNR